MIVKVLIVLATIGVIAGAVNFLNEFINIIGRAFNLFDE